MEDVLFRFLIVWIWAHILMIFIEWYRYNHGNRSWYGFKNNGMLAITYIILSIDIMGAIAAIVIGLGYWIFQWILQPIIK